MTETGDSVVEWVESVSRSVVDRSCCTRPRLLRLSGLHCRCGGEPCRPSSSKRWTPPATRSRTPIDAANEEEAQQKIRQMGYFVTKLTADAAGGKKGKKKKKAGKKKSQDASPSAACRSKQLVHLHPPVLDAAGRRPARPAQPADPRRPDEARRAQERADRRGRRRRVAARTLSEAFGKHPKCFDRLYVNMVKAGEAGGALEVILQRLADFKEKAQSLKRKIIGAMVYPVVVIIVAVAILTFIMIFIIPKFKKIFDDFGMKLPWADARSSSPPRSGSPTTGTCIPLFPLGFCLLAQADPPEQGRDLRARPDHALDPDRRQARREDRSSPGPCARWARSSASGVPILEALSIVPRDGQQRRLRADVPAGLRVDPRGRHHRRPAARRAGSSTTWS